MKKIASTLVALSLAASAGLALAEGDAGAGKAKSVVCAACHGTEGVSSNDLWPNLAGQKAGYLAKQIKAFRDGVREDATMKPMVQSLTDQDADNLAAYYSSL